MPTDDERREVARRLRGCRGGWSSGECYYAIIHALGLSDTSREDGGAALYAHLADLIEPSEKVRCVAEVKFDGERLEQLAYDAAVELTGIDREALLALASGLEADADRILRAARNAQFGAGPRMGEAKHDAYEWRSIARIIREALGVSDD